MFDSLFVSFLAGPERPGEAQRNREAIEAKRI